MLRNVARSGKGHFVAHSHCEISFTRSMTSRNLLGKGRSLCAGPVRKLGATVDWVLRGTCGMSGGLGWASILECRCWRRISMRSSQSGGCGWCYGCPPLFSLLFPSWTSPFFEQPRCCITRVSLLSALAVPPCTYLCIPVFGCTCGSQ